MNKKKKERLTTQFPRDSTLPTQSSKYWAKEKDRYLRQLLLSDIEDDSGRETIVYFSQLTESINHADADDLSEIIEGMHGKDVDLIIHTPGGEVDAVEKLVTVLKQRLDSYRVIVPSWAKSGGTVIAMSAQEILLGVNSELGPIDPQMFIPNIGPVPCEFVAKDTTQPPVVQSIAKSNVDRMKALAKKILKQGMLKDADNKQLDEAIEKLSSSTTYKSHGAVIDYTEACDLGLTATWLPPESDTWKRIWLLYCCYDYDSRQKGLGKITEGVSYSISRLPLRSN